MIYLLLRKFCNCVNTSDLCHCTMTLLEDRLTATAVFDPNDELLNNISLWVDQCNSTQLLAIIGTDSPHLIAERLLFLLKHHVNAWYSPVGGNNIMQKQLDVLNMLGPAVNERDFSEIHVRHVKWTFFKDRIRSVIATFQIVLNEEIVDEIETLALRLSQLINSSMELFKAASAIDILSDEDKLQSMTPAEIENLNALSGRLDVSSRKPNMRAFDAFMSASCTHGWRKSHYSFDDPSAPVHIYQQKHLFNPLTDQVFTKTFFFVPVNLSGIDSADAGIRSSVVENVLECLINSSSDPLLHAALVEQGGKERLIADIKRCHEPYRLPDLKCNRHLFLFNDGVYATHFPLHATPEKLLINQNSGESPFHQDFYDGIGRAEHFCYFLDPRIASGVTTVPGSEYPCKWNTKTVSDIPPDRARTLLKVDFEIDGNHFSVDDHVSIPFMRGRYAPTQLLSNVNYTLMSALAAKLSLQNMENPSPHQYALNCQRLRQPPLECFTNRGVCTWRDDGSDAFLNGRAVLYEESNIYRAHQILIDDVRFDSAKLTDVHPIFAGDISRVCVSTEALGSSDRVNAQALLRTTAADLVRQFHLRLFRLMHGRSVPPTGPFKSLTSEDIKKQPTDFMDFVKRMESTVKGDQASSYNELKRCVEHETLFDDYSADTIVKFLQDPNRIQLSDKLPNTFQWIHRDFVELAKAMLDKRSRQPKRARTDSQFEFPMAKYIDMCNRHPHFELSAAFMATQSDHWARDFVHVDDISVDCALPGCVGVCNRERSLFVNARTGKVFECTEKQVRVLPLLEQYRGDGLCPRPTASLTWQTKKICESVTAPNNIMLTDGRRSFRVAFKHRLSGVTKAMLQYVTTEEKKQFGTGRIQERELLLHVQRRLTSELQYFYETGDWTKLGKTKRGRLRRNCSEENQIVDIIDECDQDYVISNFASNPDKVAQVNKDDVECLGSAWRSTTFLRSLRPFDCMYDLVLQERTPSGEWSTSTQYVKLLSTTVDAYHRNETKQLSGTLLNYYFGWRPLKNNIVKATDNCLRSSSPVFGAQKGIRREGRDGFQPKNEDIKRMRKFSAVMFRECLDTGATQRFFPHDKSNRPLDPDKSDLDPSLCAINAFDEDFEKPKRFAEQSSVSIGTFPSIWHPKACDAAGKPLYSIVGILPKTLGIVSTQGPVVVESDPDEKFVHAEHMDKVTRVQLDASLSDDHETTQRTTYGMLGRQMHYGGWDNMQVALLIMGKGETGKSAMVSQLRRVYPEEYIGQLTSNLEPLFGLSPLMRPMKFMALCPELKGQGPLPPTDLLSCISCEQVSAAVKNGRPAVGKIMFNCFFLGNDLPEEWVREGDRGNAMSRRFVVRLFPNQVRRIDNHLQSKAQRTMAPFIIKSTRSYARLCWTLGEQGIYESASDIRGHTQKHVVLGRHYMEGNRKFLERCNKYMSCLVTMKDEFAHPNKFIVLPGSTQTYLSLYRLDDGTDFRSLIDVDNPAHPLSKLLRFLCDGRLPSGEPDLQGAEEYLIYYREIHERLTPLRMLLHIVFLGTLQEHTSAVHELFRQVCAHRDVDLGRTVSEVLHGCDPLYITACSTGDEIEVTCAQCPLSLLNDQCRSYVKSAFQSYMWLKDIDAYRAADGDPRGREKWDKNADAIAAVQKDPELSQFFFATKGLNPCGVLLLLRKYNSPVSIPDL